MDALAEEEKPEAGAILDDPGGQVLQYGEPIKIHSLLRPSFELEAAFVVAGAALVGYAVYEASKGK